MSTYTLSARPGNKQFPPVNQMLLNMWGRISEKKKCFSIKLLPV